MLEDIVESALYTEVKELKDGKKIVMDPETEKLYYRKSLSVFSVPVYRFLKNHDHPAIPRIKTFWQEEGKLVVIEDLIQGRTLEELLDKQSDKRSEKQGIRDAETGSHKGTNENISNIIDNGKGDVLSFEEKKRILLEICDGLIFLHEAQPPIIHRDIKASNIMVTDEGRVMIIDYDAAKQFVPGSEKDTVLIGTQGIAAPEQYGFAQSDQRTDIYAFGKLVERVIPESEQAMRIAGKATRFSPSARYKSVREMKADLAKMWDPKVSRAEHNKEIIRNKLIGTVRKKSFKIGVVAAVLLVIGIAGKKGYDKYYYPEYKVRRPAYEKAEKAIKDGDYEKAKEYLEKCGLDYRDCQALYDECEQKIYEAEQERLKEQYQADFDKAKEDYLEKGESTDISALVQKSDEVDKAGLAGDHLKEVGDAVLERVEKILASDGVEKARSHMKAVENIYKIYGHYGYLKNLKLDYIELLREKGFKREAFFVLADIVGYESLGGETDSASGSDSENGSDGIGNSGSGSGSSGSDSDANRSDESGSSGSGGQSGSDGSGNSGSGSGSGGQSETDGSGNSGSGGGSDDDSTGGRVKLSELLDEVVAQYRTKGEHYEAVNFIDQVIGKVKDWKLRDKLINNYRDPIYYDYAEQLMVEGKYKTAVDYYGKAYRYKDADSRINDARYQYCLLHTEKADGEFKSYLKLLVKADYPGAADLKNQMEAYKVVVDVEYRGTNMVAINYTVSNGYGNTNLEYSSYIYTDDGNLIIDKLRGNQNRLYTNTALSELYYHMDRIEVYDTDGKLLTTWRR